MREERERQVRAEQDANRKARRGTVTDEERKRVHLGRLQATRSRDRAEDRAQLCVPSPLQQLSNVIDDGKLQIRLYLSNFWIYLVGKQGTVSPI